MTTRPLAPEEIIALDRALLARGKHRDRLFFSLALSTGFRVSELLTLQVSQLLDRSGHVAREITISRRWLKGGRGGRARSIRSRRVALSERAREAIAEFLASLSVHPAPDRYVFASRVGDNRPVTRCHLFSIFKTLAREIGLDAARIGCHSTRKSFAQGVYVASGHDLVVVQQLLGHSSPQTTARYLRRDDAQLDACARSFDPLATPGIATPYPADGSLRQAL
jgi:integrase